MLHEVGGEFLDFVDIGEIKYQGALVSVPAQVARDLAENQGGLAYLNEVMTIRPQSAYTSPVETASPELRQLAASQKPTAPCIAALLDGYPVEQHEALVDRLKVLEVEIGATQVPVTHRRHGTAMASLVAHGDLHGPSPALSSKLAVIPVLTGTSNPHVETTPPGKLPIGVIYRALLAMLAAGKVDPDLASITVINHSICDTYAPFVRRPSPWAALIDHFSHHHRLLFVVSAGNIFESFRVDDYANLAEMQAATPDERQAAILLSLERGKAARTLLSPAETVNGLTVGALHADGAQPTAPTGVDPFPSVGMTNLASAVGFGANRCVKPDLVEHGGRFVAGCANIPGGGLEVHAQQSPHYGHLVASPSPQAGDLRMVTRISGTSNAAALVTRSCVQIAGALDNAYDAGPGHWTARRSRAVILKTLAAHSSGWGPIGSILESSYPPIESKKWSRRRDTISKFLGYGRPNIERVLSGEDNRITLLADDEIPADKLHEYRIPIPSAMFNTRDLRSLIITLSWTAPIITTSMDYRGIGLKLVNAAGKSLFWDGVERKGILQPNGSTSARGTLTHIILEGKKLRQSLEGTGVFIGVQAFARHPSLQKASVPYAIAVTLEMAQSQNTNIYNEVRDAIRTRVTQRATVRTTGRAS